MLAATWLLLATYASFSSVQARTWRASWGWAVVAGILLTLLWHASPLVREFVG